MLQRAASAEARGAFGCCIVVVLQEQMRSIQYCLSGVQHVMASCGYRQPASGCLDLECSMSGSAQPCLLLWLCTVPLATGCNTWEPLESVCTSCASATCLRHYTLSRCLETHPLPQLPCIATSMFLRAPARHLSPPCTFQPPASHCSHCLCCIEQRLRLWQFLLLYTIATRMAVTWTPKPFLFTVCDTCPSATVDGEDL